MIGHWAWGMGHGALGTCTERRRSIGHWKLGMGHLLVINSSPSLLPCGKLKLHRPILHALCPMPHTQLTDFLPELLV